MKIISNKPQFDVLKCLYSCPHYMDGPVMSICKKYGDGRLNYENGKPQRNVECRNDTNNR